MSQSLSIIQYPHDLGLGGVQITSSQYCYDFQELGHNPACATKEDGLVGDQLRERGIPVFVLKREEDLVDVAREFGASVLHGHTCGGGSYACKAARQLGIVGGETVHSMVPGENPEADFEVCQVHKLHAMRPQSTLIYWCFSMDRFKITKSREEMRAELGIPQDAPVIGRNGRLDGSKNPTDFVRCLARLPGNYYGLLSGWGAEYDNLWRLAISLGCANRLAMPGRCDYPGNVFEAVDCIVYSTVDESLCAGVVEPLLLEKPVVCYAVGAMDEFVQHGKTGLHARNVDGLVGGVLWMFANPEQAAAMGRAGRLLLESKGMHDSTNSARACIDLYRRCLQEKGLIETGYGRT